MDRRWFLAFVLPAMLAGCGTKVVRVDMDSTRLVAPAVTRDAIRLGCRYRLQEVVDARPHGEQAGGLSQHAFRFTDAAETVRRQLSAAGLDDAAGADAPAVTVRIMQLYLAQNLSTKIPVAVYQVTAGDEPAFVIRSQPASMNWNGTQDEAYAAYARVMADANQQMIRRLNARCGMR
jgi:hypothetical protein